MGRRRVFGIGAGASKKVAEAVSGLGMSGKDPKNIRILGIPTRNRENQLVRCLQSYLENLQQHRNSYVVHIVDDSDHNPGSGPNGQSIKKILKRYDTDLLWVDRPYRRKLADAISEASDTPEHIVRFGMLGDTHCSIRTGGCRNTLLLMAAGHRSIQVDDDTICRIHSIPGTRQSVSLSSQSECNQYWYNPASAVSKQEREEHIDFFSLHETLLGKHPGALVREHQKPNIDRLEGRMLGQLGLPEASVAVTLMGAVGDSGMFRHWQRLCMEGDSFRRLVGKESSYRQNMCTRKFVRGVSQPTIGDGPFCMAMNIGLDTRRLLPPFMPVQRNQDGIFGRLLHLCFKQACRGYLPYGIVHDPPDRPHQVDLSHALSVGPLRSPDVLEALLQFCYQWPFGEDPAYNMEMVGHYLSDLSQFPLHKFKAEAWERCVHVTRSRMNYLQQCLNKRWDGPDYWKSDVRQVISNFQELMLREDLCIPCDLPGTHEERLTLFRDLVGKFGQLLIHWPAIWETAKELNKQEVFKAIAGNNI